MAIARKIAYNVVFNVITKIISTILALVSIGFITRYLGKQGFGDYSTVLAFFSFFGSLADLGLYVITAREISRENADEQKILGNAFSLRFLSSLFVFMLSPIIIFFLPYSHEVKTGIIVAAASFVFSSTYMVLNGVFQKNLAMDKVAATEVLGKILQVAIVVFAVHQNLGFAMIIMSMLIASIFNFIIVTAMVNKYIPLRPQLDLQYCKKFLRSSAPLGLSAVVIFVYFKIDTILLSILKTNADVGIYNAAYKVIENISFFPAMIIGLVFPLLSKNIFSNKTEFERIANETMKVFLILVMPMVIGALFLAPGIIHVIGGASFSEATNTLRILIFALAFIFFGGFFNNILIAANLQKKMLYAFIGCAIFNVTANLIFIPIFSYTASAVISTLTEFFVMLSGFYFTLKYVRYVPAVKHLPKIILSSAAMGVALYFFNFLSFIPLAILGMLVYVLFLWLTKTITLKELASIIASK